MAEPASYQLTESIARHGITYGRMKTGTPVRIDARSVHFDQMETQVREEFRERLEIDTLAQRYDPDKLEELLDNIVEMYCCPRQTQYVGKQPQTTKAIRLRLDKLTSQHVEYIFDVMSNTTQPIKNIMAYLRTTILNAPTTMEHYYQAQGNWLTAQNRKK